VASSGISSPALLPSSSEASSGAAQWVLGMVCLVEVGLKPGKRASPPLATSALPPASEVRPLSPGYAGAETQGFTPVPGTRAIQDEFIATEL
jgi:hypothetical protein